MSRGLQEFFRFLVVGAGGFVIDLGFFLPMILAGIDVFIARAASALLAITATWWINKEWTFRSLSPEARRGTYPAYLLVQCGGLAVSYSIFAIAQTLIPAGILYSLLAFASGATAALLLNFAGARGFVFRNRNRGTPMP